jgi:hypothetical protein
MRSVGALAYAEGQLAEAEAKAEAWRRIADGLRGLNGDAPPFAVSDQMAIEVPEGMSPAVVAGARPKGTAAVLALTSERPGIWTRKQIMREFGRRSWFHTTDRRKAEGAVDAAIHRLVELGRATKVSPGTYRFGKRQEATA